MQSMITAVTDYEVAEYLLVLSPTGEVCRQIWSFKRDFKSRLNAHFAVQTGPHLTLAAFLAYKKKEETIVNRLRNVGAGLTPFTVRVKDFGCYDSSRTIYVNVISKNPVQNVVDELKQARHLLKLNVGFPPKFTDDPHISVCRRMEPQQYDSGWSKYSAFSFSGSFVANGMTLLKRLPEARACQRIGLFPFQSTPTLLKQGSLFA